MNPPNSGLPELVADAEDLARFITQSNHLKGNEAKPAVFLPSPKSRETSVSRHGREPAESLWQLGLSAAGERTLYGAAIFKAATARKLSLEVTADEPPPRHAVLRGWQWVEEDPEMQKAKQKEIAEVLASEAETVLRS